MTFASHLPKEGDLARSGVVILRGRLTSNADYANYKTPVNLLVELVILL